MGANIPCCIHLGLQQKPVVINVTYGVAAVELFEGEDRAEVGERGGRCLVEESMVAVHGSIGTKFDEQVGIIGCQNDVVTAGYGFGELAFAVDTCVALFGREEAIVAEVGFLGDDRELVGLAEVGGCVVKLLTSGKPFGNSNDKGTAV